MNPDDLHSEIATFDCRWEENIKGHINIAILKEFFVGPEGRGNWRYVGLRFNTNDSSWSSMLELNCVKTRAWEDYGR